MKSRTCAKLALTVGLLAATVSTWAVGRDHARYARLDSLEVHLDDTAAGSFGALAFEKTQHEGTMADPFFGRKRFVYGPTASNSGAATPDFNTAVLQATDPSAAPVPEPSTYAMILGGLALVGFLARRRTPR